MRRKVILDIDPGVDDAMALCIALYHPQIEVVAVTAVGGNVPPDLATRNVQALLAHLDPPRLPRIGAACYPNEGLPVAGRYGRDVDSLTEAHLRVSELRSAHPAEKLICDEVRAAPGEITIVALGPLTNVARALQRDAELAAAIGQIVISGGAVASAGNVTPAAEFNIFCDPEAAQTVFRSPSTKTLIPLDVTNRVVLTFDFLRQLPPESTKVGMLLRAVLPPAFRVYHQELGVEGIHCHDTVALIAATCPELFSFQEMAADVETAGHLTTGATVFDRRRAPAWRHNLAVAQEMDSERVTQEINAGLKRAADRAGPVDWGKPQ